MTPTWDILVCSIPHRHDKLGLLLDEIARQHQPGVGVIVYRDNLETGYGAKCQRLLEASRADYVCFVDDDDMIHPEYVTRIRGALDENPDYAGFRVKYLEDGQAQVPVFHSLRYDGWVNRPNRLTRDISHLNPMRRDLALRARFAGGNGADYQWAADLRKIGCLQTEVFLDFEAYEYWHSMADTFEVAREPMAEMPERHPHEFVTWL